LLAVKAATTGRRGPGQPGSARVFPSEPASPAAAFGPGMALDVLPGGPGLAVAASAAAADDRFDGVSEAELIGLLGAWDRVEAHAAARKLAVVAEVARRNPAPEDAEFTADQLACALGESRARAYELMGTAGQLDTHLPGTRAALRDGTLSVYKAKLIAMTIGSISTRSGRSTSCPTAPSSGPPRPGAATPPNPPGTPSDRAGPHKSRIRSAAGWEQQIRALPSAGSSTGSGE
jgi:hypothetical protein